MAILGFQLVSTLIGVSLLSKLATHFSFAGAFVFDGILRCLLPTNKEILDSAGLTKVKSKGKKYRNGDANGDNSASAAIAAETFHFPRATPLQLRTIPVRVSEVASLPLFSELVWLVDFSVCALAVIALNELVTFFRQPWVDAEAQNSTKSTASSMIGSVHSFFAPSTVNLILVWCLFLVYFSLSSLFSLVCVYFQGDSKPNSSSGSEASMSEWPLLLVAAFSSFIAAMFCLSLDVRFFDLRIAPAWGNLSFSGVTTSNIANESAMSWGMFQASLALFASIIGLMFTFPGFQCGRIYMEAIKSSDSIVTRLLFHLNFIAPLFTLLLWIVPLTARLPSYMLHSVHASSNSIGSPWLSSAIVLANAMSPERVASLRLFCCALTISLRVFMTKRHMQAYLNTAQARLDRLNKEPGKISNIEVQRIVASVFHCFNFAALQYLAPTILLIGLLCSYKVTTGTPWIPSFSSTSSPTPIVSNKSLTEQNSLESILEVFAGQEWDSVFTAPWFAALQTAREAFAALLDGVRQQASFVCEGVIGFALWWCLVAWQAVAVTGMCYYRFQE